MSADDDSTPWPVPPAPASLEDVQREVEETVAGSAGTYDSAAIARDLVARYGLVSVCKVPGDEWWSLVLSHEVVPAPPAEFTFQDGLDWLGITRENYLASCDILKGRHGNPLGSAVLAARDAQGTGTTAAQVLAKYGIDPGDPLKAVRAYDRKRGQYDA